MNRPNNAPRVTIPFPRAPKYGEAEIAAVTALLRTGRLSDLGRGPATAAIEDAFADSVGTAYALSFNSGTASVHAALHGAIHTANADPRAGVAMSPLTWISAITAAFHAGSHPRFVDLAPGSPNLDPAAVPRECAAVLVTHAYGVPAPMDEFVGTRVPVVEDCSHAHGELYRGRPVGSWGAAGAFSLQESKAVSAGEGGILTTDDRTVYEHALTLGHHPARLAAEPAGAGDRPGSSPRAARSPTGVRRPSNGSASGAGSAANTANAASTDTNGGPDDTPPLTDGANEPEDRTRDMGRLLKDAADREAPGRHPALPAARRSPATSRPPADHPPAGRAPTAAWPRTPQHRRAPPARRRRGPAPHDTRRGRSPRPARNRPTSGRQLANQAVHRVPACANATHAGASAAAGTHRRATGRQVANQVDCPGTACVHPAPRAGCLLGSVLGKRLRAPAELPDDRPYFRETELCRPDSSSPETTDAWATVASGSAVGAARPATPGQREGHAVNPVRKLLLGAGALPDQVRPELDAEGLLFLEEGLFGSVTVRNYRGPGTRGLWEKQGISAAVAVTGPRLVVYSGRRVHLDASAIPATRRLIDVPRVLNAPNNPVEAAIDKPGRLCLSVDISRLAPHASGVLEVRVRTPRTAEIAELLHD